MVQKETKPVRYLKFEATIVSEVAAVPDSLTALVRRRQGDTRCDSLDTNRPIRATDVSA